MGYFEKLLLPVQELASDFLQQIKNPEIAAKEVFSNSFSSESLEAKFEGYKAEKIFVTIFQNFELETKLEEEESSPEQDFLMEKLKEKINNLA